MFGIGNRFGGARRSAASEASQEQAENSDPVQDAQTFAEQAANMLQAKVDELAEAHVKLPELDRTSGQRLPTTKTPTRTSSTGRACTPEFSSSNRQSRSSRTESRGRQ